MCSCGNDTRANDTSHGKSQGHNIQESCLISAVDMQRKPKDARLRARWNWGRAETPRSHHSEKNSRRYEPLNLFKKSARPQRISLEGPLLGLSLHHVDQRWTLWPFLPAIPEKRPSVHPKKYINDHRNCARFKPGPSAPAVHKRSPSLRLMHHRATMQNRAATNRTPNTTTCARRAQRQRRPPWQPRRGSLHGAS